MSASVLLWLDSIITTDEAGKSSICEFLFQARQWFVEHDGHMEGFAFPATGGLWWEPLRTPFKAKAKPGCRIWRVPAADNITQALATTPALMTLTDGRVMDVLETWLPGGQYPAFFVVFRTTASMLVAMADECASP